MPAGNASNTVFTAIPVGEDFYMSFSTERFFHNIVPADVSNVTFKLYDARIIGSVGNPNPNALIETVVKSATPNRFTIGSAAIAVSVASATLDAYEVTKTAGVTTIFRGELYGYVEAVVAGEETGDITRLSAAAPSIQSKVTAATLGETYWDGYFVASDLIAIACKGKVIAPATTAGQILTTGFNVIPNAV